MTTRETIISQWKLIERPLARAAQWDGRSGIILISPDKAQSEAVAREIVEILQPDRTFIFSATAIKEAEWKAKCGFLNRKERQDSLIEPFPKKPCIIVLGIDEVKEWLRVAIKYDGFEHAGNVPACIIGTATEERSGCPSLRSFFANCKRDRRRK